MRKALRKLRGWMRLYVAGVCPHCKSDALNHCPICDDCYTPDGMDLKYSDVRIVWTRFVSKVDSE